MSEKKIYKSSLFKKGDFDEELSEESKAINNFLKMMATFIKSSTNFK